MTKGKYVDGFVIVAPRAKVAAYKKMAQFGAKLWKRHGALDYKECLGDDMNPDMGGMPALTFPKMGKAKKGEVVWFSFIVFKNKKHRDQVNAKVMKDPEMNDPKWADKNKMPFDMRKFAYGGFKVVVD